MISLLVTQLLVFAAALVAARGVRGQAKSAWAGILAGLGLASALVFWGNGFAGADSVWVSAAGAGLATVALWLVIQPFVVMPLAGYLCLLFASVLMLPLWGLDPATISSSDSEMNLSLLLHVLLSVAAYAAFSLAAMQSMAVVWMSNKIKQHQLAHFPGAGSLEQNERAWLRITQLAWALVALAVVSGIPSVYSLLTQQLAHKVFFALLALLLLSVLLMGRRLKGWREKTAAKWVLGAWVAMNLGWLGTKLALALMAA